MLPSHLKNSLIVTAILYSTLAQAQSVGEVRSGTQVMTENPGIRTALKGISHIDWFLSESLERGLKRMNFWFVENLRGGQAQGPVSFRIDGRTVIRVEAFSRLDETAKAFVILREVLNVYLFREGLPERDFKIRSFTQFLRKMSAAGSTVTREQYYLQLSEMDVSFAAIVDQLDPYRSAVEFVQASDDERVKLFKANPKPWTLTQIPSEYEVYLTEGKPKEVFERTLKRVLTSASTLAEFQAYLSNEENTECFYWPVFTAFEVFKNLSREKQNLVMQNPRINEYFKFKVGGTGTKEVEVIDSRLMASDDLSKIAGNANARMPVADLRAGSDWSDQYRFMMNAIMTLANADRFDLMKTKIFDQEAFYTALNLKRVKASVQAIALPIERERALAIEALDEVSQANIKLFLHDLQGRLGMGDSDFAKLVPMNRF